MTLTGRLVGRHRRLGPRRRPRAHPRAHRLYGDAVRLPLARAAVRGARRANCSCARWRSTAPARPSGNGTRGATRSRSARSIEASLGLNAGELSRQGRRLHQAPASGGSRTLPHDRCGRCRSAPGRASAPISACATPTTATAGSSWKRRACPTPIARAMRCVGLVRDVTDAKRAHERLLHDAVHDSLTGLPNRELVLDRLGVAVEPRQERERGAAERHLHRHRQVQERQRLVRPRRRRQPAAHRRAPPAAPPRAARHAGPRRRRPVRHPARLRAEPAGARRPCRARSPLAARADQDRRARRSC